MNTNKVPHNPKDLVSGGTHLFAAIMSVFGIYFLTLAATQHGSLKYWVSLEIFGISMLLLYSASTLYHLLFKYERLTLFFKRIDHMMIYVFIAGSSTPICLLGVGGKLGVWIFIGVWTCALLGCLQKIFWIHAPRWISTALYVMMGWAFGFVAVPLIQKLSFEGFIWLLAGGLSYTVGAIVYGLRKPNIFPKFFGFHELFHIFVMLGSFCHFWTVINFVK